MKLRNASQLELFGNCSAQVFAFPTSRMVGELRDSAREIASLPPEKQKREIELRSGLIWLRFISSGISKASVDQEITIYRAALINEIERAKVVGFLFGDKAAQHGI